MLASDYTSIRLEKRIRDRLQGYQRRLAAAVAGDPSRYPYQVRENPLSLGAVIEYLLMQQSRHTARSGKAKLAQEKKGR